MTCPKCKAEVPEGMQFCTGCGAVLPEKPLRPPAPASPPKPPQPTAPRPIAVPGSPAASRPAPPAAKPATPPPAAPRPTPPAANPATPPVATPPAAAPPSRVAPPERVKAKEEDEPELALTGRGSASLEDSEETPRGVPSAPGGVVCRFCKGPLDLNGDFCEQCGAPVEDAAPPGMLKPKSKSAPAPPPQVRPDALTMRRIEPLPPPPQQKTPAAPPPPAPAKPVAPARASAPAASAPRVAAGPAAAAPVTAAGPVKKPALPLPLIAAVAVVVLGGAVAAWYFMRSRPAPQQAPSPQAPSAPATAPAAPPPLVTPASAANVSATAQPKTARVSKPAPAPAPAPATPATNPQRAQISNFQNQAREAYAKGNYAEPLDASAVAFSKRALELDPGDQYSKSFLENSVNGGKYQLQQAISKKDFAAARRLADALAQLLPGRSDITGLKEDIAVAERAEEAARRPVAVAQGPRFRVYHMHTEKAPADKGPYCLGSLSLVALHLKFAGESASDGQNHNLDIACSDVREIKKNARVASKQGGFHVRTASTNINFAPEDASAAVVPALASGCAK